VVINQKTNETFPERWSLLMVKGRYCPAACILGMLYAMDAAGFHHMQALFYFSWLAAELHHSIVLPDAGM